MIHRAQRRSKWFLAFLLALGGNSSVAAAASPQQAPSAIPQFFLIGIILLVFYFFVIAPQRKEMQEKEKMREGLKRGDKVVTAGGIHGEVTKVEKNTVTLRIGPKVETVFDKVAVARKLQEKESRSS
ncbi:MAG: preprotein translocase subunit YajC [Candidatus Hydrogenedentota bacterium]|nr:MAG: preprotein translocase subunit YajC [Candidatus Hydrogenedentota bacterium]